MKLSLYLIPVLLPVLAMMPTASSKDVRAGSSSATLKKINLEGKLVSLNHILTFREIDDGRFERSNLYLHWGK